MARNSPARDSLRLLPALAALLLAGATGCGGKTQGKTVKVLAGAGLRPAIEKMIVAFRDETGIEVVCDYGGSGAILGRAALDAEADLFLPGDVWYVDRLNERHGLVESRATVAYLTPVIIVRKDLAVSPPVDSPEDLLRLDLTAAVGDPNACQIGRSTVRIFEASGLDFSQLKAKEAFEVTELATWVDMKSVEISIVWDATAVRYPSLKTIEIPAVRKNKDLVSTVVACVLKTSKNKDSARKFMDFLTGDRAKAILKESGYRVDPP